MKLAFATTVVLNYRHQSTTLAAFPIIGMSAYAVESEREKAIATGCDEFDAKPIEFESLVTTIRRVLAPHK